MGLFSDITVRSNSDTVTAEWWNILRTAGIDLGKWAGQWTKYTKSYSDFSAAALSNDIELLSLSSKEMIIGIIVKHSTAFSGSGVTGVDLSIGISGDLERYMQAFDVNQSVADSVRNALSFSGEPESFSSSTSIRAQLTATGANLDQLSAGSVDIWVKTTTLPS